MFRVTQRTKSKSLVRTKTELLALLGVKLQACPAAEASLRPSAVAMMGLGLLLSTLA